MLVVICATPYVVYCEGNNLIFWSYFCSPFLVFNFYMRIDCGLRYLAVYRHLGNQLRLILDVLYPWKDAYAAHLFNFHLCVAAIFKAIYAVDLYFYAALFSSDKGAIYEEMMQRGMLIVDKVTRARRR
ncbi:hypothetical protein IW262DRAFT_1465646 [Armillaria fumosa]|nr:hypothetical protein IW262DRAFT_1465646 [Armillaria fumosa]